MSSGPLPPQPPLAGMPLRRRLVAAISLVMMITMAIGLALTYFHARRKVDVEMNAAMVGGRHIVEREVEELDATPEAARDLPGLVRVFNGHRHIRAKLVDASGRILSESRLDTSEADVPGLLLAVLGGPAQIYRRDVALSPSEHGAVVLESDARSEVGEVSGDAALDLTVLSILFVLVLVAVNWILARALASFGALGNAFERIGRGDYEVRVAEAGPPEFARLSRSCNDMAGQLGQMDAHARRLGLQLTRVQEEERADLARNLHDEVSPLLFAVDVDATAIRDRSADLGGQSGAVIHARAEAIRDATAQMKRQVRMLLGRLRPAVTPDLGLREAIDDLVSRERRRHPGVAIHVAMSPGAVDPETEAVVLAIARESLSNALQHGKARTIQIAVEIGDETLVARIVDDGRGLASAVGQSGGPRVGGYGIIGMRERVEARGGRFDLREREGDRGVRVEARLPLHTPIEAGRTGRASAEAGA